VVSYIDKK